MEKLKKSGYILLVLGIILWAAAAIGIMVWGYHMISVMAQAKSSASSSSSGSPAETMVVSFIGAMAGAVLFAVTILIAICFVILIVIRSISLGTLKNSKKDKNIRGWGIANIILGNIPAGIILICLSKKMRESA